MWSRNGAPLRNSEWEQKKKTKHSALHHGENPEENPSISKDTLHRKEGSIAVKGSEGPDGVNRENFLLGENLWRVKVKKARRSSAKNCYKCDKRRQQCCQPASRPSRRRGFWKTSGLKQQQEQQGPGEGWAKTALTGQQRQSTLPHTNTHAEKPAFCPKEHNLDGDPCHPLWQGTTTAASEFDCRAVCRGNIFKKGIISSEPTKKDTDRQKVASPGPIIIINICLN